jgi:hypothetical protein
MIGVFRYDVGTLGDLQRTPQGGFRIPAFPTRVGVFPYRMADGTTRREYRPPEEVLDPASLATLAHAPVTDLHPEQDGVRVPVTPDNYKELALGHVAENVRAEGDHVACDVLAQDAGLIQKIDQGLRKECSSGYTCQIDPTSGTTPQGEVFDVIQRHIRYNHLALGPEGWGRAGGTVALRLDSGDGIQDPQKDEHVEKETIDGKEYIVGSAEWRAAKNAVLARITAERDAAQGRADAAEQGLARAKAAVPDPKVFQTAVTRRVALITDCRRVASAARVTFDEAKAAVADDQNLILEAIMLLDPTFKAEGKSPEYLAGYFASLVKGLGAGEAAEGLDAKNATQTTGTPPGPMPPPGTQKTDAAQGSIFSARQGNPITKTDAAEQEPDPEKARQEMLTRNRNAWKPSQKTN